MNGKRGDDTDVVCQVEEDVGDLLNRLQAGGYGEDCSRGADNGTHVNAAPSDFLILRCSSPCTHACAWVRVRMMGSGGLTFCAEQTLAELRQRGRGEPAESYMQTSGRWGETYKHF